jgi:HK97 family phage portal protein
VNVQRSQDGMGREYLIDGVPYRGELHHVPAMIRPQALKGLSPIESAAEAVGLELAGREFGARFFGSGAHLSGVIESPGPLTPDQAKILKTSFAAKHGGLKRSHLPGVLTEGAKWTPISISPEQAQFLDTRRFTAAEIASLVFGVDPAMLGLNQPGTSITYANLEQRGIHFVQFTMLPWIVRLERLINKLLGPPEYVKLNVDGLLRADTKTRYDAYAIGVDKGWLRTNEVRELEDLPQIEGGGSASPQEIAVMLQKIYLAVGKVISAEEAREIVNRAGGDLDVVLPDGLPSVPVAMADTPPPQEGSP